MTQQDYGIEEVHLPLAMDCSPRAPRSSRHGGGGFLPPPDESDEVLLLPNSNKGPNVKRGVPHGELALVASHADGLQAACSEVRAHKHMFAAELGCLRLSCCDGPFAAKLIDAFILTTWWTFGVCSLVSYMFPGALAHARRVQGS